ncbi:MAG: amidohydrolase [Notoacmeibacter sp.]|nr:amidohydrolase [Notoacmeibacter sp.]
MPILNRAAELTDLVTGWRRHLHTIPELSFDLHQTADFIESRLKEIGCDEIHTGLAETGIVALIRGARGDGPVIALRADMDALPILEATGAAHASQTPGKMHACGHDGHSAMLLGAAKYLAETRNFAGTVALIFQPAEEEGGGGNVMVREGMMERFGITRVFGMHNAPGIPLGHFATRPGPIMASTAEFDITVTGLGGHAAHPHETVDPVVAGCQIVNALQSIASRNADPVESIVVSVTCFHAGDAYNVIPQQAKISGTVRALKPELARLGEERLKAIATSVAAAHGATATIHYDANYPVTVNHARETAIAVNVAQAVAGEANVEAAMPPTLGGEDFSYMLEARPGNFIFIGNGDTAGLHHPNYDFNDEVIPHGITYWVKLTERLLPPAA